MLTILEYVSELWDGCSRINKEQLEKMELEDAKVITGTPKFAWRKSLYIF